MAAAASAVGDPTTGGGSWGAGDVCEASASAGAGWEFGDSGRGTSVCIRPDGAASAISSILSATGLRAWIRSACSGYAPPAMGERLRPGGERPACAQPLVSLC